MKNMATNKRKKKKMRVKPRQPGVHGVIPGSLLGALLTLAGIALGYLYISGHCVALGDKISSLEKQHAVLKREIQNEEYKWARAMSPENIERLLEKHNLDMIWPPEDSVVRLPRNPPPHLYAEVQQEFVARE
jgi:hypothetical protein